MRAVLLVLALFLAPPATEAQHVARPWRLGFLAAGSGPAPPEAFRTALRDLGYIEGQNLIVESRFAGAQFERLPQLARELVKLGPDVIVAVGTAEVQAVKHATTTIPIVMISVSDDPVALGFVTSLARPGGNVTGLTSTPGPEFHAKRLELLRELAPGATKIALLVNPGIPATAGRVQATEAAARALGVQVRVVEVRTADELNGAFSTMKQHRIQAVLVSSNRLFSARRVRLVELAAQARMPAMYDVREYVEAGGLAAYGAFVPDLFSRAAGYVDRLLKGRKPADLAVEQPAKFELILNRTAANALGLAFPPSLLLRADHVIE